MNAHTPAVAARFLSAHLPGGSAAARSRFFRSVFERVLTDIPVNHSPTFAPVIQPTLDTDTQALVVAALA